MPHRVLFCHGLESAPIGRKSQGLIDLGYDVEAPDCRDKDLATRIGLIVDALRRQEVPPIVVGSSFGGIAGLIATSMAARDGVAVAGLVLCAPALQLPPPPQTIDELTPPCETIVVHGLRDDVIPIALSRSFAAEHGAVLVEVDDDHRLAEAGFEALADAVRHFADLFSPTSV